MLKYLHLTSKHYQLVHFCRKLYLSCQVDKVLSMIDISLDNTLKMLSKKSEYQVNNQEGSHNLKIQQQERKSFKYML